MAIIQISKIQVRSGDLVDLPQLDEAEFGFANDEKRLFIGKTEPNENVEILTSYSSLGFSQIDGANGANLSLSSFEDGQVLVISDIGGNVNVTNRGGTKGGNINLGYMSDVIIYGGSSGQVLTTDGTGNLTWTSGGGGGGGSPTGSNRDVQFNDGGTFGGVGTFQFDKITGLVTITNNLSAGNVSATGLTGTLSTAAQPNITSVGTLTSLGVSGTATASRFVSNVADGTAPFTVTSTTQVANLNVATAGTAGTATSATNASALLQNTSVSTTVYPTFTTLGSNGNSQAVFNTSITANLANASITATTFVGALSGAATSAATAGTVTTAAQPNITSVGTLTSLGVSGNITSGNIAVTGNIKLNGANITANGADGNIFTIGDIACKSLNANGLGVLYANGLITATSVAVGSPGNVVLYQNGNIYGAGDTVIAGNLTVEGAKANLGPVANVIIEGGVNGYSLITDGTGNLSWANISGSGNGTPGGSNTQIQFNDENNFAGFVGFTFDKISGNFAVPNNASFGGNITFGNSSASNISLIFNDGNGVGTTTGVIYTASPESMAIRLNNSNRLSITNSENTLLGNLLLSTGNLHVGTTGTFELANANASTIQAFGNASAIAIGKAGSTVTLRGNIAVDKSINFVDTVVPNTDTSIYYAASPEGIYTVINNSTKFVIGNAGGSINYGNFTVVGNSLGYGSGSGGTVTQDTSRTTSVTLNKPTGSIQLFNAAGTTSWTSFTVNNNLVAETDTIIVNQKSGSDQYQIFVTQITSGTFTITFATTGGTTTEQPIFNFNVIKGVTS